MAALWGGQDPGGTVPARGSRQTPLSWKGVGIWNSATTSLWRCGPTPVALLARGSSLRTVFPLVDTLLTAFQREHGPEVP